MEQELIQAAVKTFCAVPEIYQKVFQQMGADFPDELVQVITTKPEEAVQMVQQNKELLNNIVAIYQQYGDQINQAAQQQTGMFAKDGKLGQLLNKYQIGGSLRKRGKLNAYRGSYPEYTDDGTWVHMNGADIKNIFSGNTLEQNVVTSGINGVPRRSIRVITNYDIPAKSDTTYIDANGLKAGRNPGFLRKLFGNFHTPEFMNSVDEKLKNAEPIQLSEREVIATNLKRK